MPVVKYNYREVKIFHLLGLCHPGYWVVPQQIYNGDRKDDHRAFSSGVPRIFLSILVSSLIFGVIISGFTFLKLDAYYQEMVKGIIIVGAVVLDQYRQKRAAARM